MPAKQPNILFIMADQLGSPVLPAYGHPVVKTPNIDRIAAAGTVFENPYCNSPLCSSSRASMLSGRLPSEFNAFDNATEFPSSTPTFAHYLRALGYRTCLSGKMHLVGPDQLHGFEERLNTDFYPVDFGWTPDWEKPEEQLEFFHTMESVTHSGVVARSMPIDYDDETTWRAVRHIYDVRRDPHDERPFFIAASLTHPHDPYLTTREYYDLYRDDEIDMPRVPFIPVEERDAHSARLYYHYGMHRESHTDEDIRRTRHAYYGMISYVDARVGELLDALERTGQADNTIVIFTADHGDMLGERGMWYKMSMYERSASVPFIVSHPDIAGGRRISQNMSLVDLFPTLVEFASGETPDPVVAPRLDGSSLVPLMEGRTDGWPDTVYSEYMGEGTAGPCLMVRRGRYKYVHSDGEADAPADPPQLFDLEADPDELDNLAGRDELQDVERELAALVHERWDADDLRERVLDTQKRRRFIYSALSKGRFQPWDYEPRYDAANRYIRNGEVLAEREARARLEEQNNPKLAAAAGGRQA
ncbi:Choline-sulfatase [wastewater metagenome]|uniref:Choline-sulfatase n=2 Tax=unclassified sequences TaxID=12908 RepID=A0A5B8RJ98_9ZZZZ|nr:choline-sulfatase [Arhodomonas sp. KWT]QEA06897.1 choline-sulfatase [uncultured organism]